VSQNASKEKRRVSNIEFLANQKPLPLIPEKLPDRSESAGKKKI